MTTHAMPLLINSQGQHLELRNAADEEVPPVMQLKTGEEARAAARRALEEFFGMSAPEDAIKEGFQARVGNEVVAIYPIDAQRMDMELLRPAESIATWAWKDVPKSMGNVVALGFPRNLGVRRNSAERPNALVTVIDGPAAAHDFHPAAPPAARTPEEHSEASRQYALLQDAVTAKASSLRHAPAHERAARAEELAQATEDLRLLAADMGLQTGAERVNSVTAGDGRPLTARACIRQNDGTILAARQKDGRSLLPGGHLENGETPEDAVARELQEELGLDIRAAMTGESYDFAGEDGASHRVFMVDGGKLDLSKMTPGDDVGEVEIVNSPFTDSHGAVHPQNPREAGEEGDVQELERHVEGMKHELGEMERKNADTSTEHTYPDRMNGAFPVLLCNAGGQSAETVATQETDKDWRCEACGAVIAGPPMPETVVEGA
jgi:ADP-ribose pyrophosphatase YjhB (NUDIX family)